MCDENVSVAKTHDHYGNPLEKKVAEWLNSQGYPLELYTGRCCRKAGLEASQSWYYRDRESGQQRETDVFAHTRRVPVTEAKRLFQLSFTFECKQSRAKPWVAFVQPDGSGFMGRKAAMVQRIMPVYTQSWWEDLAHKAGRLGEYPFSSANPVAHSLARVSFDKSGDDVAYSALMSVTKAAIGVADWLDLAGRSENVDSPYFTVIIPVLVLDSQLYGCHLDENGDEMVVSPIDHCTMQWRNQVGRMPTTIVEVVTKDSLPLFLQEMKNASSAVQNLALKSEGQTFESQALSLPN